MSIYKNPAVATAQDTREFFTSLGGEMLDHCKGSEIDAREVLPVVGTLIHSEGSED